jgi:hypothetical protein
VLVAVETMLENVGVFMQRVIVCAAMRDRKTGNIICSVRHWDKTRIGYLTLLKLHRSLMMNKVLLTTSTNF